MLARAPVAPMARETCAAGRICAPDPAEVNIPLIGSIGDVGASLANVLDRLSLARQQQAQRIRLTINSEGGKVDQALSIFAALRTYPGTITAIAQGSCCSAAMVVFLAADRRVIRPGTHMLIHRVGIDKEDIPEQRLNAEAFRRHAGSLEETDARILDLLVARTGYSREAFANEILTEDSLPEEMALAWGI